MAVAIDGLVGPGFLARRFRPRLRLDTGLHIIEEPNGTGKSVFLNALIGFYGGAPRLATDDGTQAVLSYFSQDSSVAAGPIGWNVFLATQPPAPEQWRKASQLLAELGLEGLASDPGLPIDPRRLSGGQVKKIGLVRLLMRTADLYLLDEPTNDLDTASCITLGRLLAELSSRCPVIVISHDARVKAIPHQALKIFND